MQHTIEFLACVCVELLQSSEELVNLLRPVQRVHKVLQPLCEDIVISVKVERPRLMDHIKVTDRSALKLLVVSFEKGCDFISKSLFVFVRSLKTGHALDL